jgi:hypothetical protein
MRKYKKSSDQEYRCLWLAAPLVKCIDHAKFNTLKYGFKIEHFSRVQGKAEIDDRVRNMFFLPN